MNDRELLNSRTLLIQMITSDYFAVKCICLLSELICKIVDPVLTISS